MMANVNSVFVHNSGNLYVERMVIPMEINVNSTARKIFLYTILIVRLITIFVFYSKVSIKLPCKI